MNRELREDLFYFIIFGPGFGESIVLRAPGEGWIVVDGCLAGGDAPAASLIRDSNRPWSCIVLTHPHLDHASGLDRVLGFPGGGPVGCADTTVEEPGHWRFSADPERHLQHGAVEHVLATIHDRWTTSPEHRWLLRRGDVREVGRVRLRVLHPPEELVRGWRGRDANRLSSALLVEWQGLRLLLGADVVNEDWANIAEDAGDLASHAALKVPHHGSTESLHDVYGGAQETGRKARTWVVTPYNRGRKLPGFRDGEGLAWLLEREDRVYLTGLPVRFESQPKSALVTTRDDLLASDAQSSPPALIPLPPPDPACFVAIGFDAEGTVQHEIRGSGSVLVCRDPNDPAMADIEGGSPCP